MSGCAALLGHKVLTRPFRRPKRRHLVIAEFIEVCIEEGTLLDETGELALMSAEMFQTISHLVAQNSCLEDDALTIGLWGSYPSLDILYNTWVCWYAA